jgi:hypothetical protein
VHARQHRQHDSSSGRISGGVMGRRGLRSCPGCPGQGPAVLPESCPHPQAPTPTVPAPQLAGRLVEPCLDAELPLLLPVPVGNDVVVAHHLASCLPAVVTQGVVAAPVVSQVHSWLERCSGVCGVLLPLWCQQQGAHLSANQRSQKGASQARFAGLWARPNRRQLNPRGQVFGGGAQGRLHNPHTLWTEQLVAKSAHTRPTGALLVMC